ncbi:helix-turn-helix domain-containing protein [Carnobacterium antarcticum]|uniref:RodZ domain-containing protein n=1 Tax=Carnobacterium antarcticum TaxID=2126436 RepID=A0ABW4NR18_9LACT|nr:RodZ domain-containing protein [Carnobacterium sp. CP1]ALV22968.1 Transcriptional regulator [Carnobacterium sp. CP1]
MNEIGEKLQEARKAKGYTLDDLQQMTKIQKRYLIAIEEGNYNVMPGKFYARAFIKQYADTVGLNGDQLLEEYTDIVPHTHDEEYVEKVSSSQTRSGNKTGNELLGKVQDYLPTLVILLVVVVIAAAIYFAFIKTNQSSQESLITKNSESVVVSSAVSNSNDAKDSSTEDSATSESEKEETKQVVSVLSSTGSQTTYSVTGTTAENTVSLSAEGGESWVSVEADGTMIDQALLTDGDVLDAAIPADTKTVNIVVGNASVTGVKLNDENVDYAPEAANAVTQKIEFQFEETE